MYKISNRIIVIVIFLEIICVLSLIAYANEKSCDYFVINNNSNLEYLKFVPISKLYSNDPKIKLPTPSVDYIIPTITNNGSQKLGLQLNICPPVLLSSDISCETCFHVICK